jgi:hypothetical protein
VKRFAKLGRAGAARRNLLVIASASEAIQRAVQGLDCFVAPLLAMTIFRGRKKCNCRIGKGAYDDQTHLSGTADT